MTKTNNKGFSLVELIIVIAIMAILIGVLAPQYIKYVEKSRVSSDEDMFDSITKAVQTACTDDAYYDDIEAGDKVTVTKTGGLVTDPSGIEGLAGAMNEYYGTKEGKNEDRKPKSKEYAPATVTITVVELKDADDNVTGYTAEREVKDSLSKDGTYK